jgi:excisionase family DNA binding protein
VIPPELEAKILKLYHADKWTVGTIAKQLGIHHNTVERVLSQGSIPFVRPDRRPSMADPYIPFIIDTLEQYPTLTASRLYAMVKERGYPGAPDHFRSIVARYRPRPKAEAYLRLQTLPGEQAQADWAHFGKLQVGQATRVLWAFILVLSWSRQLFLRFFLNQNTSSFLRGHAEAFSAWDAVPRSILYDNLKSVVLERHGEAIRFNPQMLSFAGHYRFEPRPVAVARANEKGRVERAVRYARQGFFVARKWRDIDDLNDQARAWCFGPAGERRCPSDNSLTVAEAFERDRHHMLELPEHPFEVDERREVKVGKTPYVRFDLNDYSVPHTHVRKTLTVFCSETTVRILDGNKVIARHERTYDKGQRVENPDHLAELTEEKLRARKHRGMDRLAHASPSSQDLLVIAGERGANLGSMTAGLLRLLDRYGAAELEHAIVEALKNDAPHLAAIRQVLDRRCLERGSKPPIPVALPNDPRVRDLVVTPHHLQTYDKLNKEEHDDDDN